jgi:hypothetical protein
MIRLNTGEKIRLNVNSTPKNEESEEAPVSARSRQQAKLYATSDSKSKTQVLNMSKIRNTPMIVGEEEDDDF